MLTRASGRASDNVDAIASIATLVIMIVIIAMTSARRHGDADGGSAGGPTVPRELLEPLKMRPQ